MICPVCSSQNTEKINTYTTEGYSFYRCVDCDVIFTHPMKAGTKEWYEAHNFYTPLAAPKDNHPWYEEEFIKDSVNGGRGKILNIGCGYNTFLVKLQDKGYDVTAIDINENIVEFSRSKLGIEKVYNTRIEDFIAGYKSEKFDVIIFFELLEHLEEPGNFLRSLRKILKKGGFIVFSVPNRKRFRPQAHWADYPPHHLTRWSRESVINNLKKSGFQVVKSIISPISAEQIMYASGIYFGTLYLEKKRDKNILFKVLYKFLYRFRVIFYNIIAILLRAANIFKEKGTFIYTVGKLVGKDG